MACCFCVSCLISCRRGNSFDSYHSTAGSITCPCSFSFGYCRFGTHRNGKCEGRRCQYWQSCCPSRLRRSACDGCYLWYWETFWCERDIETQLLFKFQFKNIPALERFGEGENAEKISKQNQLLQTPPQKSVEMNPEFQFRDSKTTPDRNNITEMAGMIFLQRLILN